MAWKRNPRGTNPSGTLGLFLPYLPPKIKSPHEKGGDSLMRGAVETTDIFRGAYLLCHGGRLREVRCDGEGGRQVSFLIEGEELGRLEHAFRSGEALVNPLEFREWLNHLRDLVFQKLRESGMRGRYDRARANRYHKAGA
jgi:hypothetical protein